MVQNRCVAISRIIENRVPFQEGRTTRNWKTMSVTQLFRVNKRGGRRGRRQMNEMDGWRISAGEYWPFRSLAKGRKGPAVCSCPDVSRLVNDGRRVSNLTAADVYYDTLRGPDVPVTTIDINQVGWCTLIKPPFFFVLMLLFYI